MKDRRIRRNPERLYSVQKSGAKQRGIAFLLSFEEWMNIWLNSGHWHERGRKKGQYVMARYGDAGPYSVDNVSIVDQKVNCHDRSIGNQYRRGRKHSEETKEQIKRSMRGKQNSLGKTWKLSAVTKEKMHISALRYWQRQREGT